VKHALYNGENRIGRDASCCSVSVCSKVGLDYNIYVTFYMYTHIRFCFLLNFLLLSADLKTA
jgi:hypothetical protein